MGIRQMIAVFRFGGDPTDDRRVGDREGFRLRQRCQQQPQRQEAAVTSCTRTEHDLQRTVRSTFQIMKKQNVFKVGFILKED